MGKVIAVSVGVILIIGCGGSPDDSFYEIDISKPKEGENFTLPAQINVQATNIPLERNSDPEWYMVENTLAWDYTWLPSFESTFSEGLLSKSSLYSTNDQFGDHTVAVKFVDKDNNEQVSGITVQIFFNRDDWTAGGSSPNWYYYWSQAFNVNGDHIYDPSLINPDGTLGSGATEVYSSSSWLIRIGPAASWPTGNPPTGHKYIDGFWATNLHEFWHRDHRVHNFSVHGSHGNPSDPIPLDIDPDQDGICNNWEATIGTDSNIWTSTETGGNWAESNGSYGYDPQDWAYPGSQWY